MEFIPCSKNTSTGCEGLAKEKIDVPSFVPTRAYSFP